jgi:hypothetical protein
VHKCIRQQRIPVISRFQTLIGSRSSRNSPKSLHTISSLSFTFVFLTSLEWIGSRIREIRGGEVGFVARLKTETKVESKCVKQFLFDFKLCHSMFKVIWRHFHIWVL